MPDDPFYHQPEWYHTRVLVLKRDNYHCVQCQADVKGKGKARVDHIIPRKQRPDLGLSMANLRTLCTKCDGARHAERFWGTTRPAIGPDGFPLDGDAGWGTGKRGDWRDV